LSSHVATVSRWLPEDTQTLIVAEGPFKIGAASRGNEVDALGLKRTLQLLTLAIEGDILSCDLRDRLFDRTVSLSVAGSRRFRFPKGLGPMRYEGARITIFREGLGADGKALTDWLSKQATRIDVLSGVPVITIGGEARRDAWDVFWSLPGKNVDGSPPASFVAIP
jgi:hypothetical protein